MGKAILVAAALLLVGALGAGGFLLYRSGAFAVPAGTPALEGAQGAGGGGSTSPQPGTGLGSGNYKKYGPAPSGRPAPPSGGGASNDPAGPRLPAPRPP